jgi:hypothetical protein
MKLYMRDPDLNSAYKDGSRAKDRGAAITTNPFTLNQDLNNSFFAWRDGWNKIAVERAQPRFFGQFNNSTSAATDPTAGHMAINNAAYASATAMRFGLLTLTGVSVEQRLRDLPVGTIITAYDAANVANFCTYTTNAAMVVTTFGTVNVTYGSSSGTVFANNDSIVLEFTRP